MFWCYVARAKSFRAMILIVDFTSAASSLNVNLPAPDGSSRYCDISRGNTAPKAAYKMLLLFSTNRRLGSRWFGELK